MRLSAIAAMLFGCATLSGAQSGANWTYYGKTGPLGWGRLDPAYKACSQGPRTIAARHSRSPPEQGAPAHRVPLHCRTRDHREHGRNTVIVHVDPGSYIVANGIRYDLLQFHFHHPGEEAVKGKLADMDVHLVHQSADGKLAIAGRAPDRIADTPTLCSPRCGRTCPGTTGANDKVTELVNAGGAAARRPRLLDLHRLRRHAALHRRRALVCLSRRPEHQPRPVACLRQSLQDEHAPLQDPHGRRIEANE